MDVKVLEAQKWLNNTYGGKAGFSKFSDDELDGITGNGTFKRLIQALQIEINSQYGGSVTVDGDFGNGTLKAMPSRITRSNKVSNIVHIIQASLWCKGYNAGEMDGIYGDSTASAVRKFQADAGIAQDGDVKPYILQGIMNTDGYVYKGETDCDAYYKHIIQKNMNLYYGEKIGLTAPNGEWERKSHKNYIKCCQIEWGLTADGVFGNGTMNKAPTLSVKKTGYTASKRLLKWGLTINGFYPGDFDGTFDNNTYNAVYEFQKFLCLGADGIAGKNTWASLLSSRGNTARTATACDTSTQLTLEMAKSLKAAGYTDIGRYLTNVSGGTLNKKLTSEEISNLAAADLRVFPIYQTTGRKNTYFTNERGIRDAWLAKSAAIKLGFPKGTVIYFAADYDVTTADIETYLIPYFKGVKKAMLDYYEIGVYGPRMLCKELAKKSLTKRSFVSDMSSGFTGNIGQSMPLNWAYDQFYETRENGISIDKCIASNNASAIEANLLKPLPNRVMPNYSTLKNIYNMAKIILTEKKSREPLIEEINEYALKYLRGSSYRGLLWQTAGGLMSGDEEEYMKKRIIEEYNEPLEEIEPTVAGVYDYSDNSKIVFDHLSATLNACNHITYHVGTLDEKVLDAYAGWAGDLMQMCGDISDKNPSLYEDSSLYKSIGSEYVHYKFSKLDLMQDIDGFNMHKLYDWKSEKIYDIFNDYYYGTIYIYNRYSLFKRFLLDEFKRDTLSEIAFDFISDKYLLENIGVEIVFGGCPQKYNQIGADAFERRIDELISME